MDEPTDMEVARWVRAAIGYSGKDAKDIAAKLNIPYGTFRNYMSPSRPTRADLELRHQIADLTRVPRRFMEEGFSGFGDDADLQATVRRLEDRLGTLEMWRAVLEAEGLGQSGEEGFGDPPAQQGPQP